MSTYADRRQLGAIPGPLRAPPPVRSAGAIPDRWTLVNKHMKLTALGNNVYGDCVVAAAAHLAQQQAFYTYGVHFDQAKLPDDLFFHGPHVFSIGTVDGPIVPLIPVIDSWLDQFDLDVDVNNAIAAWWAANFDSIQLQWVPSYNDAIRIYANTPDYKKSKNSGRFNDDVFAWIAANGIGADPSYHKAFSAPLAVTRDTVRDAIYWLGGAVLTFDLPNSVKTQRTWRVIAGDSGKPGSFGGHDVCAIGYSPSVLYIVSWGKIFPTTWAFFDKYATDVWSDASYDWVNYYTRTTPVGDTWELLQARFGNSFAQGAPT